MPDQESAPRSERYAISPAAILITTSDIWGISGKRLGHVIDVSKGPMFYC
jgi:hypothetical protein